MALQINLLSTNEKNDLNFNFSEAYARIESYHGKKNMIYYKVSVYPDSSSANTELRGTGIFRESHQIIKNDSDVSVNLSSGNILTELYAHLKTQETFKDGIDV
jgi:hypothetical protein